MNTAWDRFWHAPIPAARLAWFRVAVAWLCLYDAFLYDPSHLLRNVEGAEATWHPLVLFDLLGLAAPTANAASLAALAYKVASIGLLLGFRTRAFALVVAVLSFWQGGVLYSLTKVRHDRVVLAFATWGLVLAPCGGRVSFDAWWQTRRGRPPAPATTSAWPIRLAQVTLAIGYCAAGLTKLLQSGWTNGYTLQGIVLGHRGTFADMAAANVLACRLLSIVTVLTELLVPVCLWLPRAAFLFVPMLVAFHWGTWATMDTGPYLTLWYLSVAFVPLDRVRSWASRTWGERPLAAILVAGWAIAVVAVVAAVFVQVVPWPWLLAAGAAHGFVWRSSAEGSSPPRWAEHAS